MYCFKIRLFLFSSRLLTPNFGLWSAKKLMLLTQAVSGSTNAVGASCSCTVTLVKGNDTCATSPLGTCVASLVPGVFLFVAVS